MTSVSLSRRRVGLLTSKAVSKNIQRVLAAPGASLNPFWMLGCSVRCETVFLRLGLKTVGDVLRLYQRGEENFLDVDGFGTLSLENLRAAILALDVEELGDALEPY